jgi:hypothetical protein
MNTAANNVSSSTEDAVKGENEDDLVLPCISDEEPDYYFNPNDLNYLLEYNPEDGNNG